MKMKFHLTNREPLPETVKTGDTLASVQLSPIGDFPNGKAMQHVTADACRAMVENWKKEGSRDILCDFEHWSGKPDGSTEAAAWITNLAFDEKRGLVGDFKFTDKGAAAVASRRYRFLSPVFECNVDKWNGEPGTGSPEEVTPCRLDSAALTNTPNLPVAPLLNKAQSPGNKNVQQNKETKMDPKKIREALGLAPEATEEEVLAAIGKMKAANEEAEKAAAEKEAADFAEANKAKIDPEVCKAQYLANKEATVAMVNAIKAPAPEKKTVVNKAEAKTPSFANRSATGDADILAKYENMAPGKEKEDFLLRNCVAIDRARKSAAE